MPSWGLILGVTLGVVTGVLLAVCALLCIKFRKRRTQIRFSSSRRTSTIPIRAEGTDNSSVLSDSTMDPESPKNPEPEGTKRKNMVSVSGIPKYSFR